MYSSCPSKFLKFTASPSFASDMWKISLIKFLHHHFGTTSYVLGVIVVEAQLVALAVATN